MEDELAWLNEAESKEEPAAEISDGDIPDWLQEAKKENEPVIAETSDSDMPDWMQELKEETIVPEVESPKPPEAEASEEETLISDSAIGELGASADDQDAAMNWLESLAANQGAKAEELLTDPNARTESAPEWVEQAKEVSAEAPVEEIPAVEVEDELAWLNDVAEEEPVSKEADDTPKWLRDDIEESIEIVSSMPEVDEQEIPQAESQLPEEFAKEDEKLDDGAPTWIKEMEESSGESVPPAAEAIPPAEMEEDLPAWLSDLDGGAGKEEEEYSDEPLPDWIKAEEKGTAEEPQPTQASEWKPIDAESGGRPATETQAEVVSEVDSEVVEKVASEKVEKVTAPEVSKEQAKLEKKKIRRRKRMDTTMLRDIKLMGAEAAMDEGNISAALKEYEKLIKKNRLLDEVIYDLREALVDYPIDISITQMLGDAYMRAGRLQEAIDAYTNAEKLLR